jgi:hypothetical protein
VKYIRGWIALAAILGFAGVAEAQVTGACPAGQYVTVIGDNIVGTACNPLTGTQATAGQLLEGTATTPNWSVTLTGAYIFTNPLVTLGAAAGVPTHIATAQTTAPALTSCGTSPAITGTDTAGVVTMGTGTPTGCVITFNVAYTAAPYCVVDWIATPLASQSYAVSTTAITLTQTATSSNKVNYFCVAQAGG